MPGTELRGHYIEASGQLTGIPIQRLTEVK